MRLDNVEECVARFAVRLCVSISYNNRVKVKRETKLGNILGHRTMYVSRVKIDNILGI